MYKINNNVLGAYSYKQLFTPFLVKIYVPCMSKT